MFVSVYVTTSTEDEAIAISEQLLEEKLIACSNYWAINSIYTWNDEIVSDKEYALLLKTLESNFEKIRERIIELHSYDIPCIVRYAIRGGNPSYLDWISQVTVNL